MPGDAWLRVAVTIILVTSQFLEVPIDESVHGTAVMWVMLCAHIVAVLFLG